MPDLMPDGTFQPRPSFFKRIPLAFGAFFKTFSDGEYARRVDRLREPVATETELHTSPATDRDAAAATALRDLSPDAALQLLGMLQREARLIDFAMENLSSYSDAEIGAAARIVHEGCRKVLNEHFTIEPVRGETEGTPVTLEEGFDAASTRLTGNVIGKAPFRGRLSHRGWRASDVRLPQLTSQHDASIIAPAEVEL